MRVLAIQTADDTFYVRDGGAFVACYDLGMVLALLENQLSEPVTELRLLDIERDIEDTDIDERIYADLTDGDFSIDPNLFEEGWSIAETIFQKGA